MPTPIDLHTLFVTGLHNAYAMEQESLALMRTQSRQTARYEGLPQRLKLHIDETRNQIRRIDDILANLAEEEDALKDAAMLISGKLAAFGHWLTGDEILKTYFTNFAFESYEIAVYTSLVALADLGGYASAVPLLNASLGEEQAMADWLKDHVTPVTLRFADLSEAGGG